MKKQFALLLGVLIMSCSCNGKVNTDKGESDTPQQKETTMRVISYNLLAGMEQDKPNGYANFIKWVKENDPDILALEEANGISRKDLAAMASQWDHKYVETNCNYPGASTYPVALTSKHKLNNVQHIVDDVHHGAISAEVEGLKVVVLHLYPFQELKKGIDWKTPADLDNDGDKDGDDFRIHEMELYLNRTYNKDKNAQWLIMGDFNSESPLDKEHYTKEHSYDLHKKMLHEFHDLLKVKNPKWVRTYPTIFAGWKPNVYEYRLDYIYGSKPTKNNLLKAEVIHDDFTERYSDHYPILIELKVKQNQ